MEDEEGDALEIELSDGDDAAPDPASSELQEVHAPDPHGSIAGGCEEQDEGVRGHNVTSDSDGLEVDLEESEPEGASLEDRGMRQGMEGDGAGAGAGDASEVIVVPDGNVGEKRALKRSEMDEVSTHFKRGKKVAGGEGLTRNLAKVKLHEMTPEEMQAIISFPPPQRGLASKQRLAINMQHPRVLEPPFAADLTRYVHAQLDALLSAGAKFLWTDRCSGFLAFCANLSCLFTGREATGVSVAKLGRFMTTDRELNQKLLTLVQRLLFAPEVAAHVSSSCAAGGTGGGRPEVEGETDAQRENMAGILWHCLLLLHNYVEFETQFVGESKFQIFTKLLVFVCRDALESGACATVKSVACLQATCQRRCSRGPAGVGALIMLASVRVQVDGGQLMAVCQVSLDLLAARCLRGPWGNNLKDMQAAEARQAGAKSAKGGRGAGPDVPKVSRECKPRLVIKVVELWLDLLVRSELLPVETLREARKMLATHTALGTLVKTLVQRLQRCDEMAAKCMEMLDFVAFSRKCIRVLGSHKAFGDVREHTADLVLTRTLRLVSVAEDDLGALQLLKILNQLLFEDEMRACILCRAPLRQRLLDVVAALIKGIERMVTASTEAQDKGDKGDKTAKTAKADKGKKKNAVRKLVSNRFVVLFRLLARLAREDARPVAAALYDKFGNTDSSREKLMLTLLMLTDSGLLPEAADDEDRTDRQWFGKLVGLLQPQGIDELKTHLSKGVHAASSKELQTVLTELQQANMEVADDAMSISNNLADVLSVVRDGKCVQIKGEEAARFGDKHLKWVRRTGGGTEPAPFVLLRRNVYVHRKYAKLTVDSTPTCSCLHRPGKPGCSDNACLLRAENVECTPGFCPCGDDCQNQRFQRCQNAPTEVLYAGKLKGWGLFAAADIESGSFVVEYMGEVVDQKRYLRRKKEYGAERHTYFMLLNASPVEMIDASRKSSMGRFLNHSCQPSCETTRYKSLGETVVGVFAMRDIKKGEELTIDYQMYDGAEGKECSCGAPNCRGVLGS